MEKSVLLTRDEAETVLNGMSTAYHESMLSREAIKPVAQKIEDSFPGILKDTYEDWMLEEEEKPTPEQMAEWQEQSRLRQEAETAQRHKDEEAFASHAREFKTWEVDDGTDADRHQA
jgi:hypothetical protein